MSSDASGSDPSKAHKPKSIDDAIELLDEAMQGQNANLKDMLTSEMSHGKNALAAQNESFQTIDTPHTGPSLAAISNLLSQITSPEGRREVARSTSDSLRDLKNQSVVRTRELYGQGVDRSKQLYGDAVVRSREVATGIDTKVRANPWPLLGGIAVGGFALGLFLGISAKRNEVVIAEVETTELE